MVSAPYQSGPHPELDIWWRHPNFQHGAQTKGTRSRVTFQLFATPRNDLFPQYFRNTCVWKKWRPMKFCVFCRGKTTENGSVSSKRSTWLSAKHLKVEDVCQFLDVWKKIFWNLHKICLFCAWLSAKHLKVEDVCQFLDVWKKSFEIYIKFACWWWFCCRRAKHFHKVLCVWICNSELRHVRIFVTPCSFYVLLQCDGKARCFFGIKMPVGWQYFIENLNCPDCVDPRSNNVVSPHGIVVWPIEQTLLWDRH